MKLIVAIVQDEDAQKLMNHLMDADFRATKLSTTGGFLRNGNTTLLTGVEDDKVEDCLSIIEKVCRCREQKRTTPITTAGSGYACQPISVTVGGATVFVLNVEEFRKI